jgi:feruloyl esterase
MLLALYLAASSPLTQVTDFGDNPGSLAMYQHIPNRTGPMPLVLALHGCGQTHQYAVDSGLVDEADRDGFALVVAEQSTANNIQACFNWFQSSDTARDQGEAKSLASMVAKMKTLTTVDDGKVFVTGVSAGAAMAVVMLADYPDVFAAGAVFAGIPYGCANTLNDAFTCMQSSTSSPAAIPTTSTPPKIQIWQGDSDHTVSPANAGALVTQWTQAHGISSTPSSTAALGKATRSTYGKGEVQKIIIPGMDHGIPLDPTHGCGTAAPFLLDEGICSTTEIAAFFGIAPSGGEGEGEGEGAGGPSEPRSGPKGCGAGGGAGLFAALAAVLWRRPIRRPSDAVRRACKQL